MKGHQFILAITDYFSKWVEVIPLIEVKTSYVVNFIKHHVIHRFGVPRWIIHDNGPQFASQVFYQFCNKYQIQNVVSTNYNPAANDLVEAFNKTIIKLFKKFILSTKATGVRLTPWACVRLSIELTQPQKVLLACYLLY